jgi:signal peptidase I
MIPEPVRKFFLPTWNRGYIVRLVLVGLICYVVFGHLLLPLRIQGVSMEPTYHDGSFAFCWRLKYFFSVPERFDVVTVRFSGRRVMLLKRIVAFEGETVEIRAGDLLVNGKIIEEPYVRFRAEWDLPPRLVSAGHIYVIGDNRGSSIDRHRFGAVKLTRIVGGVLL